MCIRDRSMAILSKGSPTLYCLIFPLLLVCGRLLAAHISHVRTHSSTSYVANIKQIESLPYFVKGFVKDAMMTSRCSIMHLLQNILHFTSGNYQLHDHVSSICTLPRPFQQSILKGKRFPLCTVDLQHSEPWQTSCHSRRLSLIHI